MTRKRYILLGTGTYYFRSLLQAIKRYPNVGCGNNNGFLPGSDILNFTESDYCHQDAPLVDTDIQSFRFT